MKRYPIKMLPYTTDAIWGGTKLMTQWGKKTDKNIIAETWELSAHEKGNSVAVNGEWAGKTLSEIVAQLPNAAGKRSERFPFFPLLVKFIDSAQNLSIQVHPDNAYALQHEGQFGKAEMWYIADCEEGAGIYCGFKQKISKEEFEQRIRDNSLCEVLNFITVQKGDAFFIPAKTIHAICAGITIIEIQQNSNVTYRVFDYGRRGADGKPRDLHIRQALDVTKLDVYEKENFTRGMLLEQTLDYKHYNLFKNEYFITDKYECIHKCTMDVLEDSFVSLTFISGSGRIQVDDYSVEFQFGDTFFVPAESGRLTVEGKCEFLASKV